MTLEKIYDMTRQEAQAKYGWRSPKRKEPKKERYLMTLRTSTKEELQALAYRTNYSMNELLNIALEYYIIHGNEEGK